MEESETATDRQVKCVWERAEVECMLDCSLEIKITRLMDSKCYTTSTKARKGRKSYKQTLGEFSQEVSKMNQSFQNNIFKHQDDLFEKQKQFELELQDREDRRQREFLKGLYSIFGSSDPNMPSSSRQANRRHAPRNTREDSGEDDDMIEEYLY